MRYTPWPLLVRQGGAGTVLKFGMGTVDKVHGHVSLCIIFHPVPKFHF